MELELSHHFFLCSPSALFLTIQIDMLASDISFWVHHFCTHDLCLDFTLSVLQPEGTVLTSLYNAQCTCISIMLLWLNYWRCWMVATFNAHVISSTCIAYLWYYVKPLVPATRLVTLTIRMMITDQKRTKAQFHQHYSVFDCYANQELL